MPLHGTVREEGNIKKVVFDREIPSEKEVSSNREVPLEKEVPFRSRGTIIFIHVILQRYTPFSCRVARDQ